MSPLFTPSFRSKLVLELKRSSSRSFVRLMVELPFGYKSSVDNSNIVKENENNYKFQIIYK